MQQDYTHLDEYMSDGFFRVDGWCSGYLAGVLKLIDGYQRTHGVAAGVAEIGIHHGRLFLILNSLCDATDRSFAIDLFEDQELNIDHSGHGSRSAFLDNMSRWDKHRGGNVSVVAADSTTVDIRSVVTSPVRIFSIDGGHTAEHTVADLRSAQSVLHPRGVVVLDDVTNDHWLGVIEGVMSFLQPRPTLVPFAIGFNKMLLANLSYASEYAALIGNSKFASKKDVKFMGWQMVAMTTPATPEPPAPDLEKFQARAEPELAKTAQTLSALFAEVEMLKGEGAAAVAREQAVRAELANLEQHVTRLHETLSWRVTAPLRLIRQLLTSKQRQ